MYTEIKETRKKMVQITTNGDYLHCIGCLENGEIMVGRMGGEEIVKLSILGLEWDERPDLEDMIDELVEEMGGREKIETLGIDFILDTIEQQNRGLEAQLLIQLNMKFKNVGYLSIFNEIYRSRDNKKIDEFLKQAVIDGWVSFEQVAQPEETPNATRIKKKGYKKNGRKKR